MLAISSAQDFHAAVTAATEKPLVACFSAPWCGGCKMVAPKVAELAEELKETVSFAKVSAEELETLCEEVEVDSFPHFRVYKEGKILGDYTSSKFDKVDAFIRGLVAPVTVKTEETPEGDATKEETTETEAEKAEGSKKRQEREEVEANDEHVAKKAKEEEPKEAVTEETEKVEEATGETEKVEETTETEKAVKEDEKETEKKDEAAPVDKSEKTDADGPVDAAAA